MVRDEKKFEVMIYYTGFCLHEIEAKNEYEALEKARNLPINQRELLETLLNWEEADTVIRIEDGES